MYRNFIQSVNNIHLELIGRRDQNNGLKTEKKKLHFRGKKSIEIFKVTMRKINDFTVWMTKCQKNYKICIKNQEEFL